MIRWLVQTVVDHPDLSAGRPPTGLLTAKELAQYRDYLSPQRRRDWLLGRWTAKRLIQAHVTAAHGFCPALNGFAIEQDATGAPYAASDHPALRGACSDEQLPLTLSISHSHGYAFCALCVSEANEAALGVDIELVGPRSESFAQDFFTAGEQANCNVGVPLVGTLSGPVPTTQMRDLLMTATWSAKEAVFKATHLDLRADPQAVQCLPRAGRPRHWAPLQVELDATMRTQSNEQGPLRAWWRVLQNRLRPDSAFVLTIASYRAAL